MAGQAEYGKVNRPFIEMSRAEIIREAVDKVIEPYTTTRKVTNADDGHAKWFADRWKKADSWPADYGSG
jgi:hypothetical protein